MKVCQNCQQKFPDNTRHCPECGQRLAAEDAAADAEGADELVGRVFFGEYTITDRLGEGGMGAVYLAKQNAIDQRIALKVLHTESADSDEIIQRFHREARVISMLSHPNIVRVFIFGRTEDDLLFMAMEHVDGHELREKLDGTPMDELTAIKIMKQICSAVAEAHDLGIIHRDLKPENVLLTEFRGDENFVKILDFGIAKIKHPDADQGPQLTQAGIVYGTPEYLSPEQAQAHDLDNRTDIYALGCILFEMVTGRVPFQADASVEILKQKVFEDPPRASDFADVAPTLDQIIHKAMAKDREDRYSDALEMFDALSVRENELKSEQHLDPRQTSFPGSELTGVHRAVQGQNAQTQSQASQDQSRPVSRPDQSQPNSQDQSQPIQQPQPAQNAQDPHQSGRLDTDPNSLSENDFDADTIAMDAPEGAAAEPQDDGADSTAAGFRGNPQAGHAQSNTNQPQNAPPQSPNNQRPTPRPQNNPQNESRGGTNQPAPQNAQSSRGRQNPGPNGGPNRPGRQHGAGQQHQGGARRAPTPGAPDPNQPPAQNNTAPHQQGSDESIERYLLIGGVIGAGIILVGLLAVIAWQVFGG